MPRIIKCHKYGRHGYKCGQYGTCYLFNENDAQSRSNALKRAQHDREVIEARLAKQSRKYQLQWLLISLKGNL